MHDLRYGIRMLVKSPSFAAVAILSLTLSIGANTAVFSLVDSVLQRRLPVQNAAQLVMLTTNSSWGTSSYFNYPLYKDYRDQNDVCSGLVAFAETPLSLSGDGQPERLSGLIVSGNYFSVLGITAVLGRTFAPEEDQTPGSHPVAVMSYGLWQRRFGADPHIVGKTVNLNGHSFTVLGIAPAEFTGTIRGFAPDLYVPIMMLAQATGTQNIEALVSRDYSWLSIIGRLKPGISSEQAQAAMRTVASRLAETNPMNTQPQVVLVDASKGDISLVRDLRTPLSLLMVAVLLVLLIACVNVASLLIARATTRRKEIAVRLALGSSRARLIRQLLTESVLLSVLGGLGGLLLAYWLGDFLVTLTPQGNGTPLSLGRSLDLRVLAFTFLLMLVTGLGFGLAPALFTSNPDLVGALKDEKTTFIKGRHRLGALNLLVIAQIALSLAVLISAGLCVKSLQNLQAIDLGFETKKVLVMSLNLGLNGYKKVQGQPFYRQLVERVGALPGVEAVSLAKLVPLEGSGMRNTVKLEGYEPKVNEFTNIDFNIISPRYFQTMGITLLGGRDFGPEDVPGTTSVIIINETMANRYWSGQDPLGKHIRFPAPGGGPERSLEIVGIVKNSKQRRVTEDDPPMMYLPLGQNYASETALHVRSATDPKGLLATVRHEINLIDPNLPVFNLKTLDEQRNRALYTARLAATVLSAFGFLALLLAAVGIYGVMMFAVNQRTHEIGIRLALGAQQSDILKLVSFESVRLVTIGILVGLAGAITTTRFLAGFLYGVGATDLATFVVVPLLLAAVTLLASYIPSRRAMKVDPIVAIRHE